jgi:hypothetical protein
VLNKPEGVSRIRDAESYREQPDLDIYAPAFEGVGLSKKFAGTDIDGIFGAVLRQSGHGLWERAGRLLVQEHKKCEASLISVTGGQHRALAGLAAIDPVKLRVIYTFGPVDQPSMQRWAHVNPNGSIGKLQDFTDDVENWPHRRWIKRVLADVKNDNDTHEPRVERIARFESVIAMLRLIVDAERGLP